MKKSYITNCVSSTAELISPMVDTAREITYRTFLKHVEKSELDTLFPFYKDVPGLSLGNDWSVTFWKSEFDGQPCVFDCP